LTNARKHREASAFDRNAIKLRSKLWRSEQGQLRMFGAPSMATKYGCDACSAEDDVVLTILSRNASDTLNSFTASLIASASAMNKAARYPPPQQGTKPASQAFVLVAISVDQINRSGPNPRENERAPICHANHGRGHNGRNTGQCPVEGQL
jgi:hypothetical protein